MPTSGLRQSQALGLVGAVVDARHSAARGLEVVQHAPVDLRQVVLGHPPERDAALIRHHDYAHPVLGEHPERLARAGQPR